MNNPIAVCLDRNPFATVDELVAHAATIGFDRLEWFEMSAAMWTAPDVAAHIRSLMHKHGVAPQYHAPYESPFDPARDGDRLRTVEESAQVLCQCLDRAETLGAKLMTVHLGNCPAGCDRSEAMRRVMESIRLSIPELERRHIRLALENHTRAILNDPLGDRPEEFEWLMENLQSEWIGRTLDIGHAHINNHLDEFLSAPLDRVFNFHLHDNHGKTDEHLPLGEGDIPWPGILRRISDSCCAGVFTLEFFATPEQYRRSIELIRKA